MSQGADEEFFARLAALNDKFAASLPDTLGRLAAARAAIDAAAPGQAPVAQAHAILHTLAGSSATFGFELLGQRARMLEQRLHALMTSDGVTPDEWHGWLAALDAFVAWAAADPTAPYSNDESGV